MDSRTHERDRQHGREMAAELIAMQPDVLLTGGPDGALPLHDVTDSIPMVFADVPDPIGLGLD
jgi:putative ABC transport system substrate-binding protein